MSASSPRLRRLALRFGLTRLAVGVAVCALVWWVHPHLAPSAPLAPKLLFLGVGLAAGALLGGSYRRWAKRTEARLDAEAAVASSAAVPPAT